MTTSAIVDLFRQNKLKATPQRIAVYKFLAENPIHPDVETIYENLITDNPTFSKTTVYNSLEILTQKGLLIPLTIDNEKIRYDANVNFHGHFKCEKCGCIFDFKCDNYNIEIDGFEIKQKDIYCSGLCPNCK